MKIAVITGAGAGLGLEYVRQLEGAFPEIECVWLIARSADKLEKAAELLHKAGGEILPLDLCDRDALTGLEEKLRAEKPEVALLVNNAGCGVLGNVGETDWRVQTRVADLNVSALTAVTALIVPYMKAGGRIINVSSIASFCPNPRMTVYSSTKAYVSAFSRGLGEELKGKGITVTAVCSGPMATDFLDTAGITGKSKTFDTLPYCDPVKVVRGSYAAARAGRAVHTPKAFYKLYRGIAKVLPQCLMVKFAGT